MPYKDPEAASAFKRAHYAANKQKYRDSLRRARDKRNEFIIRSKRAPCSDCGNKYPYYVMDFDHVRGDTKLGNISRMRRNSSLDRLQREIDKCDLVCSNCHRERTHQREMLNKS